MSVANCCSSNAPHLLLELLGGAFSPEQMPRASEPSKKYALLLGVSCLDGGELGGRSHARAGSGVLSGGAVRCAACRESPMTGGRLTRRLERWPRSCVIDLIDARTRFARSAYDARRTASKSSVSRISWVRAFSSSCGSTSGMAIDFLRSTLTASVAAFSDAFAALTAALAADSACFATPSSRVSRSSSSALFMVSPASFARCASSCACRSSSSSRAVSTFHFSTAAFCSAAAASRAPTSFSFVASSSACVATTTSSDAASAL